jgi:hypothetical protein
MPSWVHRCHLFCRLHLLHRWHLFRRWHLFCNVSHSSSGSVLSISIIVAHSLTKYTVTTSMTFEVSCSGGPSHQSWSNVLVGIPMGPTITHGLVYWRQVYGPTHHQWSNAFGRIPMGQLYFYGIYAPNEPTLVTWAMTPHGPMLTGSSPLGREYQGYAKPQG